MPSDCQRPHGRLVSLLWGAAFLGLLAASARAADPEEYFQLLGELRARQREFDWPNVVRLLERGVELNPTEPRHWWDLGLARARLERYEPAIEAFRRADALGGGFDWDPVFMVARGEALFQIACCQAQLGQQASAFETLQQALATGLRRPKRLMTESRLESLRDEPRLRELAGVFDSSGLSRDEGLRADLKFLKREMLRLHYQPYHVNDAGTIDAAVSKLDADIPELNDNQVIARFQQIVSLLGDGHSGLRIRSAHVLPVRFFWFDDGLLITAVRQPHARLLGAQVLQLNGRAIDEVLAAFAPIVSHDNPMNIRAATPRMLRVTEYLAGLGLAAETRSAELLVRLPDGSQERIRMEAEPLRDRQEGWEGWIDTLGGEAPPLSWKIRDRMLWFSPTPDGRVLYAQINGMGNPRGDTFKAFSERLLQFVDAHPEINRLVLDFRRNGGGDTFLNRPLIQGLVRSRLNRPGGLAVLIGRDTFSAAQNTITEIERHTEAIFVGEPSGSRPNFIGESVEFTLPYSNHGVSISDLYWVTSSPLDRRMWIAPKVYVPPTAADFLARRDPALEAAVQGTLGVATPTPVARTESRGNERPTEPTAANDSTLELLRTDRELADWTVTEWSDLAKPAPAGVRWTIRDEVLQGSNPRGTWLMSTAEYGDFVLEFEWKLPDRGNSGVALRAPLKGDPAFGGLEVQMVDPRYHPAEQKPQANELTGSLYRAVAPTAQVFKPNDWNRYVITCRGPQIQIVLNGQTIQDLNLDEQTLRPERHDGTLAPPLKDRPRRGHIGFQELSRGGGQVEIRNVRLRELR